MVLISKYRTVAVAMFTSVLLAVTSSTSRAQELPLLQQGMPYSEARQLLLDSGWQALLLQWNYRESKPSGVAESLINDFGYDELVDCAGTGLGFCRFEFSDVNSQTLVIVTVNNDVEPALYRWWLEERED